MEQIILENLKLYNNIESDIDIFDNSANGERAEKAIMHFLTELGFDTLLTTNTTGSSDIVFHPKGESGICHGINIKSTNKIVNRDGIWKYVLDVRSRNNGEKKLSRDCIVLAVYFHDIRYPVFLNIKYLTTGSFGINLSIIFGKSENAIITKENRKEIIKKIHEELISKYGKKIFIDMNKFRDINNINKAKELFS